MKKRIIIGIIIIISLIILSNTCITGNCVQESSYDDFAKYLTSEGISMAGTDWCSHCKAQKELFGDSFRYVDFHNCDSERSWCLGNGVEGYPTWIFPDGQLYPGTRSIEQLKELSGYDE